MNKKSFDYTLVDSQATEVSPVNPAEFDFDRFADHEQKCLETCREFKNASSGILVNRRLRAATVFSADSSDMRTSLELQLGALTASMDYPMDIPNFLEPWYGIGVAHAAYGQQYEWHPGQAPAMRHTFASTADALAYADIPIAETDIGRHILEMITYFLDKTDGRLPISLTDVQSPLNAACGVVDINSILMDMVLEPESVKELLMRLTHRIVEFTHVQLDLIGERIAWPGHGFASSRAFTGMGMSDDNVLMISSDMYRDIVFPSLEMLANAPFGGIGFHSCGDWSGNIAMVKEIPNLRVADGAFTAETDPTPNTLAPFVGTFDNTGVVLNARMVGTPDTIEETLRQLATPRTKLIAVTTCATPAEQEYVYNLAHRL